MKLILALGIWMLAAAALGLGLIRAVHGHWGLLLLSLAIYVLALARFGCKSQ